MVTRLPQVFVAIVTLVFTVSTARTSEAQQYATVELLTSDLVAPTKVIRLPKGDLLVSEAGTAVANTGRLSIINERSGRSRTLIDGLPSGLSAPNLEPSGPTGLLAWGRTLFFAIGSGDSVLRGPIPGSEVPNPNISSPIFSSVLALRFNEPVTSKVPYDFRLTRANQDTLKNGEPVVLQNERGETVTLRLVMDIPDYIAEPRPGAPDNVRHSNPFGLAQIKDDLFIVDASRNTVTSLEILTRDLTTRSVFGPVQNTRGFGPPFVEAVPDSIRKVGNQLLVTTLTGFPFPIGQAQVRRIDLETGVNEPVLQGLTSAIDVLRIPGRRGGLLTLEFSADQFAGAPGRLRLHPLNGDDPVEITSWLTTPTSMARDPGTGFVYITEIFTGRVLRIRVQ